MTKPRISIAFAVLALVAGSAHAQLRYPATRTVDAADTYFGKTYPDPYRWLEDLKAPEVQAWFKAQAALTDGQLDAIPGRDALAKEWTELDKLRPARYSAQSYAHGRLFYKKTLGSENVGKLYVREGWTGAEKLLFDPATYKPVGAAAGAVTTIESALPSPDGRYVALGFSSSGAEHSEIRVLDVGRRALLPESMYPSYGPLGWTMDSAALFYDAGKVTDIKSPDFELHRKTRLHKLGGKVADDEDFFSDERNPELGISAKEFASASIPESAPDYLLGYVSTVERELRVFYAPAAAMKSGKLAWKVLCKQSDQLVSGIELHKDHVYAVTHAGAPRYKLVRTSLAKPDWQHAETVIPESADSIDSITQSKRFLFVVYSNGIVGRIVKLDLDTHKTSELKLPSGVAGTVYIQCIDHDSNRCIVSATSWTQPTATWDYDADKNTFTKSIFHADVRYPGFENLVAEEVEVPGHDGTMIPLSIIHRKDLKLDGSSNAILQGYGAYGSTYTPSFNLRHSIALHGVVFAYAHVRGGGEKGQAWYKAGYKTTKPNTWKDFISAAEYLIKRGYTSASKLAGTGTSAGGILITRAITTRPELFAAAVVNVGDANALRGEFSPNGPVNTPEFGTVADPVEAQALYEMDGLQHVRAGTKYPAVLGVGGWNDPRVVPWQPGKFVAATQRASTSGKPVLLKVNYDNGHFTEDKAVTFKNFAGQFAFMLWQTGHKDFQPAR